MPEQGFHHPAGRKSLRGLTRHGSKDVRVENVADPPLKHPQDLILRATATALCGSDLHLYRGKVPGLETGDILGHEFMGVVEEVGADVIKVKAGDRVVIPFVIACATCFFCDRKLLSASETTNDSTGMAMNKKSLRPPAALLGFTKAHGGMPGGQAETVRVPTANTGRLKIPDALSDAQVLFLSDILPTGYQAVLDAEVGPGSTLETALTKLKFDGSSGKTLRECSAWTKPTCSNNCRNGWKALVTGV